MGLMMNMKAKANSLCSQKTLKGMPDRQDGSDETVLLCYK